MASIGFDDTQNITPAQTIKIGLPDLCKDINLDFVKMQNVDKLTIFIEDNLGYPKTVINSIEIWGFATPGTNIKDHEKVIEKLQSQS